MERGRVLAALKVSHSLVVHSQVLRELTAADAAVRAQDRDAVVDDVVCYHMSVWERAADCMRARLPMLSLRKERLTRAGARSFWLIVK